MSEMNDLILKSHIKPPKSFFKEGIGYFEIYHFKRKGDIISSTERTTNRYRNKVVEVRLQKNTNFNKFRDCVYIQRIGVTSRKIEHQTWCFFREITLINDLPVETIKYELVNLTKWEKGIESKVVKKQLSGLGYYYDGIWSEQDLVKILEKSHLKYTKFWEVVRPDPYVISQANKYMTILEVLENYNNVRAAHKVLIGYCDMRRMTMKFVKQNKRYLKYNLTLDEIVDDIPVVKDYYKLNEQILKRIAKKDLSAEKILEIIEYEKSNKIKERKLLRYLDKQCRSLRYYIDYIETAKEIKKYDKSWKTIFPKDLEKAHDDVHEVKKSIEKAKYMKELTPLNNIYVKSLNELVKIETSNDKYAMLIPKDLSEIIDEGYTLSHCVWRDNYTKRHAKLDTVILFVRKIDDLDKPFFTLQLSPDDCSVVQLHGYRNERESDPLGEEAGRQKPDVQKFVEECVENKKYKKLFLESVNQASNIVRG